MLSARDVELYREQGYLVVKDVLSADELAAARAAMEQLLEGARGVEAHTALYDLEDTHTPQQPRVRRLKLPHKHHSRFAELIRSDKLLALMQPLLGPDIRLQTSKLNLKSAGYGAAVEWHQDWAFYPYTNDDVLALGVLLDEFAADNGALMVLPGSHRGPVYDHHADGRFCGAIDIDACGLDLANAVQLVAPAGSITLHHARLVHGSAPNRSGRSRSYLLYEAMAADAWPLAGTFAPFTDLEEFDSRMLCGAPTIEPRLAAVPVRIPLPKPVDPSSIYQAQKGIAQRYFDVVK